MNWKKQRSAALQVEKKTTMEKWLYNYVISANVNDPWTFWTILQMNVGTTWEESCRLKQRQFYVQVMETSKTSKMLEWWRP